MRQKLPTLALAVALILSLMPLLSLSSQSVVSVEESPEWVESNRGRKFIEWFNSSTDTYRQEIYGGAIFTQADNGDWVPYIFTKLGDHYRVQHPCASIEFFEYYTKVWSEYFENVAIYDDRWTVEYQDKHDKWTDTSFWNIALSYEVVGDDEISLIRTGDTTIGQRIENYTFRRGAACKIKIVQTCDDNQTIRFIWKPSGIVADREIKSQPSLDYYDVENNFVGSLSWFDELNVTDNIDIVCESEAQRRKATIIFGNFDASAGENAVLDPVISFTAGEDTEVNQLYPDTNYGSQHEMGVFTWKPSKNSRTFLKFNYSSIYSDATITAAELKCGCLSVDSLVSGVSDIQARRVTDDTWSASTMTWNTGQPAYGAVEDTTAPVVGLYTTWNVTSWVQNQWAGDKTVSICLRCVQEDYDLTYRGSWHNSSETGVPPILNITYTIPNHAPNAPTNLKVSGETNPTHYDFLAPWFTAICTDNNDGDILTHTRIQVDDDPNFGSTIGDSGKIDTDDFTEGNRSGSVAYVGSDLTRGVTYYWRIKFWDDSDAEGLWSTETATFKINQLPTTPTNFTDLGMNLTDHTPAITWTKGTDADGDTVTTYIYVGTSPSPSTEEAHTTLETADLGSTVTLSDGVTYYYRLRSYDGYWLGWSDYTADDTFRMNSAPTTTNLKTEGDADPLRITTFAPTFSWTYNDAEGDNQSHYQIWVGTTDGGSEMWNSGEVATENENVIYDNSALSRGVTYYVQVQTKDGYEWSTWKKGTFQINRLPTQTYLEQSFYMDPPYTPTLKWWFTDLDMDTQKGIMIQVDNDVGFGSLLWDYSDGETTTQTKVYDGGALEIGVTYYARVQVSDGYENSGTWSENTFTILPIPSLVVTDITVDNTPVDRKAHWAGDDDVRISVTVADNEGRDDILYAYLWIRDNSDTVVVDNVTFTTYENVDPNTKKLWYDYNPDDIILDSALGEFDVKVQAVSTYYENTKDYTDLGFKLFTVDDHSITFSPVREVYAEGEIITLEPIVKSVVTGLAIDNTYLKLELISELGEVLRTVSGYTNGSGKLSTHTTLLEADIGFYDVRISTVKGAIDGQKVYEDVFSVVAELPVSVESVTPSDNYVSGLLRSRSIVVEDVVVKVFVYDTSGMELLSLTSDTIRVENIPPQLKNWSVPYEKEGQTLTLVEGTYSYRVEVWTADLGTMYHVYFAEVKLTVAPSQQPVGEWSCVDTFEIKDGIFDVVLYRESIVTNPTTVDKSNFYFREVVDAPKGSSVLVSVGGLPPTTLHVDKYGTIERSFNIPAGTTIKVGMEVTIFSAVKVEYLSESEVVAAVPRTVKEHQYKVTNLTETTLRGVELTFPVSGVISVADEDGKPIEKFWGTKSTTVEIAVLEPYGEMTITLTATTIPSIDKVVDILVSWTIWGIPIIVYLLGLGGLLWLLTRSKAGPFSQVAALMLPTILLVFGIWVGWI